MQVKLVKFAAVSLFLCYFGGFLALDCRRFGGSTFWLILSAEATFLVRIHGRKRRRKTEIYEQR
jgi:hypothetical protein